MKSTKIQNIFESLFSKKAILIVVLLIVFFYFQSEIVFFINKYFTTNDRFSNRIFDYLVIITSALTTFYFLFKISFYSYQPSYSQKVTVCSIVFFILYFEYIKNQLPWRNLSDSVFDIEYVIYILIPLITSLMFFVVIRILMKVDSAFSNNRSSKKTNTNIYLSDDPIEEEEEEILSYKPKIKSLAQILLNETYEKSISIGLVGPWGNGKSSVIYMTQKRIKNETREDLIMIHFLPYLNHKEEDIINEFFTSLSNELAKYSGKLSGQVLDYAKKLTEVYRGNNVFDLFNKHVSNINSTPAKELYDNINKLLIEINKKIIVFVDDLDRLSGKEIIQVLKLIRNTADFRNTIFVVAMDKDYVINRLKAENNISSTRFIDKFFQLEIYLPEIDKSILREYVYKSLKASILNNSSDFEIKLSKGLNHEGNLFEDFIKNLRDAKRLVNQIIFDYNFLKDEINLKDFFNFTYFKLKFPKFMELLNHKRLDFLEIDNGVYRLKDKPKKEGESRPGIQAKIENLAVFNRMKTNDYRYLNKYVVTDLLIPSNDCLKDTLNIDCDDVLLLSKSLAYLFGDENKVVSFNSIRKENNFRMLMQQRVFENVLLEREFEELINEGNEDNRHNILESLYSRNKLTQLISRLDYYNTEGKHILSNIVLILFRLYEKRSDYVINEYQLLYKLADFVEKIIEQDGKVSQESVNWVKEVLFKESILSSENKLSILCELWESKDDNKLWHFEEDYILSKALELFEEYLSNHNDELWKVNDYSIYKYYHLLKSITDIKEKLNKLIRDFWKANDIELLCAQSTDLPAFSLSSFKITDTVTEIFDTKFQFHEFVKNHSNHPSEAVKEFLEVYELHQITGYGLSIVYNFEHSKLMLDKISNNKKSHGRSSYNEVEKYLQIVFETNSDILISEIVQLRKAKNTDEIIYRYPSIDISFQKLDLLQFSIFTSDGKHYLFISYDKKHGLNHGIKILTAFEAIASNSYGLTTNSFKPYKTKLSEKEKIMIDNEVYIKAISIQRAKTPPV
jgi:hypothetical protein